MILTITMHLAFAELDCINYASNNLGHGIWHLDLHVHVRRSVHLVGQTEEVLNVFQQLAYDVAIHHQTATDLRVVVCRREHRGRHQMAKRHSHGPDHKHLATTVDSMTMYSSSTDIVP